MDVSIAFFILCLCLRSEWLVHPMPRYLALTGSELINTFVQGKDADSDIIDAAFRRFCQLDADVNCPGPPVRWRHFIESDFAVLLPLSPYVVVAVVNFFFFFLFSASNNFLMYTADELSRRL